MALMLFILTLPVTYLRNECVQKFIAEQLVADYTRRGFVRGRSVRLMTVTVRRNSPPGVRHAVSLSTKRKVETPRAPRVRSAGLRRLVPDG
jgi:hypothetical protein